MMTEKESTPRILLVDDEEDILEFVSYNLEREGFKVFTGRNGKEAIQMVTKVKPDLVILDVMMPEMDGIAACEEIRRLPGCRDVVIAFLTARGEDYSQKQEEEVKPSGPISDFITTEGKTISSIAEREAERISAEPIMHKRTISYKSGIRADFSLKKAVVYSEILNKKYI